MRLTDLLSRLDDEALERLLGPSVMRLLLKLDPSLATPVRLRELAIRLHSPAGLLTEATHRSLLIDLLTPEQARALCSLLGLSDGRHPYGALKSQAFPRGSAKERALFDFFDVPYPGLPDNEDEKPPLVGVCNYPLFEHQRIAARSVARHLEQSPHRVVLHMPTGSGKTRTAMDVVATHLRHNEPTVVVWLAHSEELCDQAASEFATAWKSLGNRQVAVCRYWGSYDDGIADVRDGVVIAGLAKVYRRIQRSIAFISALARRTSLVVMDEAHSAIAPTYQLILDSLVLMKYPNSQLLGLTATPGRTWSDIDADEQLATFFSRKRVSLSMSSYDNPIDFLTDEGYIASGNLRTIFHSGGQELTDDDLRSLSSSLDIPQRLLERLADDELRNMAIIGALEDLALRHSRILLFAATVQHSRTLAALLQLRGHNAAVVTGETPTQERTRITEAFRDHNPVPMILCNYGVLTTGFDAPRTSAAVIARPTKSLVLYSQMVGRAIRGPKAGGNETAEVLTVIDTELPGFRSVAESFHNWEDIWE